MCTHTSARHVLTADWSCPDYLSAKPDFVGEFVAPVMKHMNDDHSDATAAMVRHYVGIQVRVMDIIMIARTVYSTMQYLGMGFITLPDLLSVI